MTYPLGWSVIPQILVRRERWPGGYKTKGSPLVYPGQEVQPDQPVIRLEKLEPIEAMETIPRLSLPTVMNATSGTDPRHRAMNGASPASIGETIPAGMRGRVVDVTRRGGVIIESRAAVVHGAVGAGNQVAGVLTLWQAPGSGQQNIPPGAILVVPGPLNFSMVRQAMVSGVTGIVASSISSRDLEGFLQTDLVRLIDSVDIELMQAHLQPLTLLFTEGLGMVAMPARTMNLLSQYQGSIALLSGATSVRQGIFPELVISIRCSQLEHRCASAVVTMKVQ